MTDAPGPRSRPWWSYLRLSVRAMIVLVLLFGGWLGWIVHGARTQREAVAAIKRDGGLVRYDWEWKKLARQSKPKPWAPKWLVDLIGVDYFGHVVTVTLLGRSFGRSSDLLMVHLEKLGQVENLFIGQSSVTDAGLEKLKGLSHLRVLSLNGTLITDTGLEHLKGLSSLKELDLSGTRIHDAGLANLKNLRDLEGLNLGLTHITDDGLLALTGLTSLRRLQLDYTAIGDPGLVNMRSLSGLKILSLDNTKVSNAGLVTLKALTNLKVLKVAGSTGLTGTGLHLEEILTNVKIER